MEYDNYYRILGVSKEATADEIRKAFVKKNMENHPDRLGIKEDSEVWKIANDYIKTLNQAYETLSDPYLRAEYDAKYFKNTKNEERSQNYHNNKAYERAYQKSVVRFDFNEAGQSLKQKILARQFNNHLFKYPIKGVIRSYVWIGILALWFPVLYSFADSKRWNEGTIFFTAIISIVVSALISRAVVYIIKWQKSEIKSDVLVTPLYFIFTELNKITYCYLWSVKNVENTNNYKNGVYTGTTTKLEFDGFTQTINFTSILDHTKFVVTVESAIKTVLQKENNNDFKYFIDNDDLYGEKITPKQKFEAGIPNYVYGLSTFAALIIFYFIYSINLDANARLNIPEETNYRTDYSNQPEETQHYESFKAKELLLPENGSVKYFTKARRVAPLQIFTRSNANYYLKLEDIYSGKTTLTVFIRGGQSVNLKVPLGSYYMKYASGEKWYGDEILFGPYTSYSKAIEVFNFELQGNQYIGYTVELYLQSNGNLNIDEITANEF